MKWFALKMLFGDTTKFYGILLGLAFASLLISQQSSIFVGLMSRTFGFVRDTAQPDLWVVDPDRSFVDDQKPLRDTEVDRVRSVSGVAWAVPLFKGLLSAKLPTGERQTCDVVGIDDATLIAGPPRMIVGRVEDLRQTDAIIIDDASINTRLAVPEYLTPGESTPNFDPTAAPVKRRALGIGDVLELNERRAVVVGIAKTTPTFQNQPVIYTTYSRAKQFAPPNRRMVSMVLVKALPGIDIADLKARIDSETGLRSFTPDEYSWHTVLYWMKQTGIPINFGMAIALGFLVGVAVAGQMFYNFTLDNLKYFGAMKAMGASTQRLLGMVALQATVAAVLGLGLGLGITSIFGLTVPGNRLAFRMVWQIPLITAGAVMIICVGAALLSMVRVIRLDPAEVFKT
ncbi:MAG: ABC transporter permease [Phycisphaerae bacterium]|nr:ABC transporter permease [Phycisphaerae bacterium]